VDFRGFLRDIRRFFWLFVVGRNSLADAILDRRRVTVTFEQKHWPRIGPILGGFSRIVSFWASFRSRETGTHARRLLLIAVVTGIRANRLFISTIRGKTIRSQLGRDLDQPWQTKIAES